MLSGQKCLIYLIRYQLLCPTNILSFSLHCVLRWLWLWVQTAARITLTRAGLARDSTRFNGSLTAQHTTILRLTQELQLIMFNQVFIFRHAAGFTYGITEQWKMSFVEIFSLSSRISLSQDVKWDYTKYSINQRD